MKCYNMYRDRRAMSWKERAILLWPPVRGKEGNWKQGSMNPRKDPTQWLNSKTMKWIKCHTNISNNKSDQRCQDRPGEEANRFHKKKKNPNINVISE